MRTPSQQHEQGTQHQPALEVSQTWSPRWQHQVAQAMQPVRAEIQRYLVQALAQQMEPRQVVAQEQMSQVVEPAHAALHHAVLHLRETMLPARSSPEAEPISAREQEGTALPTRPLPSAAPQQGIPSPIARLSEKRAVASLGPHFAQ